MPEWKRRAIAIPALLVAALVFHASDTGHFMQRTALSMPLHELGHAVTAWWCGFDAVPTLWKTLIPETRGVVASLGAAALAAWLIYRGWTTERMWLAGIGLALGALQFLGTTCTVDTAQQLITFGGDAGAMVLGTLALTACFAGPDSKLRRGGLRWGLGAIGAAAFVDTFAMWWAARTDHDAIPFGEIEGVGLSDPSRLDETYGWTTNQIVDRYAMVGTICLISLAALTAWAIWDARRRGLAGDEA
jgi:hypothetical protein